MLNPFLVKFASFRELGEEVKDKVEGQDNVER